MGKFENFKSEQELVGRIEQLRADGVHDKDITVFSNEELEGTSLNYTDVNFKSADGTAWDKFVSFFTSEKPEERAIADLGLSEENKQDYITALEAGDVLLFVSEDAPSASEEKLGHDDENTSNLQSDDNEVGGEPLDAEYRQEEENPGLAGTDRKEAVENSAIGSTLSAGQESKDVRDEEVNVDSRGSSNQPGKNSDGSTREDKDVSDYGHEDSDFSGARISEVEPNPDAEYDNDDADEKLYKNYESTMKKDESEKNDDNIRNKNIMEDTRVTDEEPNLEYDTGEEKQDKDYEGTMRAEGRKDDGIIRDEDIEEDTRLVDEEPNREYVTNETAETVDVSTYGYDDTVNRDNIKTSSDGGNALKDEDLTRDDRAIRNKYKFEEAKESDYTEHDPDRRNFNTD